MIIFFSYLFLMMMIPIFFEEKQDDYLPYHEILNIAVVIDHKEYVLNLEQQNNLLTYLKRWESPFFEKIIIYRFNGKEPLCLNNF